MGKKSMSGRKLTFLLITIPIVALFFCFNTLPLIKGVIYSFTNFKGYGSYDWVGLRNYKDLFTDSRVGGSYLFTFKLAIVATIVTNVLLKYAFQHKPCMGSYRGCVCMAVHRNEYHYLYFGPPDSAGGCIRGRSY